MMTARESIEALRGAYRAALQACLRSDDPDDLRALAIEMVSLANHARVAAGHEEDTP